MPVVKYELQGDSKGASSAFGNVAKAAGIATAAFTASVATTKKQIKAFFDLQQGVANLRNELGDLSGQTQLSVETLASLRVAALSTNETLDSFAGGLRRFAKQMNDTADGTGEAIDAFELLGIEVSDTDGNLREADAVFQETIAALQGMENNTLRAALATDIFGRSGTKLSQALGDTPLEEFNERARIFGADTGPAAVKSAQEWQAAMADLTLATEGLLSSLATLTSAGTIGPVIFFMDLWAAFAIAFDAMSNDVEDNVSDLIAQFVRLRGGFETLGSVVLLRNLGLVDEAVSDLADTTGAATDQDLRDFLKWSQEIDDELEKDALAVRSLNAEVTELATTLSLLELGDLSEQMRLDEATEEAAEFRRELEAISQAMDFEDAINQASEDLAHLGAAFGEVTISTSEAVGQLVDASIGAIDALAGTLQGMVAEGSAAFKALFAIQKAAAIAGIVVDTAKAMMQAMATIPPPIGPTLAIAIGVEGAAQVANVISTSIDGGGSVRQSSVSADAMSGGGTNAQVDQATAFGESQSQGSVVVQFRHELYDATVPDSVRIPGSAMSRVLKNGARVGKRAVRATPRKLLT